MRSWLWGLGWGAWLSAGCSEPSLEVPRAGPEGSQLELEPAGEIDAVPRLFRARVRDIGAAEPWLFEGELSPYHDQALRRGDVASTLRARAQPLRFWRADGWLWLQPLRWLDPGAAYTVALSGQGAVAVLTIGHDERPEVERIFPLAAATNVVVLCSVPQAETVTQLTLQPGNLPLQVSSGVAGVERSGCLTLRSAGAAEPLVLPPLLNGALLPPQTFGPSATTAAAAPSCPTGEPIARACLEADDDRLFATARSDSLWLLQSPSAMSVSLSAGKRTELVRGLEPRQAVHLTGRVLVADGTELGLNASLSTAAPRRHLILNEVLANPRGAEPESEWIELVNDSAEPTTLAGLWLDDGSESVPLPPESIAPGELVLLVPRGFRASSLDVPVGDARRIELPSLGARGLANGGEALLLVGPDGVVSRFPSVVSNGAGRSIARRSPSSPDDDASAFAPSGAPGASPGAANAFDD